MELLTRIERVARDDPSRIAYVSNDRETSYATLAQDIAAARGAMLERAASGDVVLLQIGNETSFAACFLAAISAGVGTLAVAESSPAADVATLADRARPKLMLSAKTSRELCSSPAAAAASRFGDLLLPTSGSTGEPKIVRRTAASLDAVAANMVEAIGFAPGDHVLTAVPLAHSYGIEHGLLAPLWAGATVHLFNGLDVEALSTSSAAFTHFPAVPSMLERLADASKLVGGIAGIKTVYSAGAPLPHSVRERFVARYRSNVGQLYGATEIGTVTYRAGNARAGDDVGWPMTGVSIRSLETGEIAIRSPSMFSGYLDEAAPLVDGHFLTGDLGHLSDDGALVLTGRSKLLIDVGGLKVNPLEVEAVLATHADVAECIVVPMLQSETVSRLRAIVVPRDVASPPSADALRAHARARLAPHKVPRSIEIRTTPLPRSATGKLLRTMLDHP